MFKNKFYLRNVVAIAICLAGMTFFFSCKKDDTSKLGGKQSPMGNVGTNFSVSGGTAGLSDISAKVVALDGGVSSVTMSANISNTTIMNMIKASSDVTVSGTLATREREYRLTNEGIQSIYPEGNINVVKYDAKKGDVYTLKRGAKTINREVTEVSKEDKYFWNNMYIKTIHVKETGRGIPGLDYIEFVCNHKFGLVGIIFEFEDGTSRTVSLNAGVTN
jgi:hypothetical protein